MIVDAFKKLMEERKRKVLIVDDGLGIGIPLGIAKSGIEVYYYITWQSPWPKFEEGILGEGFEELNKVEDIGEVIDKVDCVLFTDLGFGYLADWLRKQDKVVWGAGRKVDRLELNRAYSRKVYADLGIKVCSGKVLKGIDTVLQYIDESKKPLWVKTNIWRGSVETFRASSSEEAEVVLQSADFGAFRDDIEFVIEDEMEGVEIGADFFFNGERFLKPYLFTLETAGGGIAGVWKESSIWDDYMSRIEGFLKKNEFKGNISVEGFLNEKGLFITDTCVRLPFSGCHMFPVGIKDFGNVVLDVLLNPLRSRFEVAGEYIVLIGCYTKDIKKWKLLDIEEEVKDKVVLTWAAKKDGQIYIVPGTDRACFCIGVGDTLEGAFRDGLKVSDGVSSYETFPESVNIKTWQEDVEKLEDFDIIF